MGKESRPKVQIIAESGVNHNNSLERAKELIRKASWAGADWVKFQLYRAETLVTKKAPKFWDWEGDKDKKTQFEAYSDLDNFDWDNYPELMKTCQEEGIKFLCTPFDYKAVDFLDEIGMKAFKIASSDLTYLPFLKYIAQKNKPIFLSTGASTIGEIEEAVNTIRKEGNNQITVMHCSLKYPSKPTEANLRVISTLRGIFDLPVGLSDHTIGTTASVIATTLGATLIEKHFTVDKTLPKSADHWLSVNPEELKEIVERVRETEKMLGSPYKKVFEHEKETYKLDKRSIVSAKDIKKGEKFTKDNLTCKRPGTGIPPKFMDILIGKKSKQNIIEDTTIKWKMI